MTEPDDRFCSSCGARAGTAPEATPPSTGQYLGQPPPQPVAQRQVVRVAGRREEAVPFSSGRVLAQWVIGALLVGIIMDVVAVFSGLAEVRLITRVINREFVTMEQLKANDDRQAVVGVLQLVVYIATAILFLVWIYRAHRNLRALNASGLAYSPGWAVGGWFIPIMNLWRPYQVTAEIWKASDPKISDPEGSAWQTTPVSPLLKFWWALWIISGIIGNILLRAAFQEPEDPELFRTRSIAFVVSDGIGILTAILAMGVVWLITTRQDEKNNRLQTGQLAI